MGLFGGAVEAVSKPFEDAGKTIGGIGQGAAGYVSSLFGGKRSTPTPGEMGGPDDPNWWKEGRPEARSATFTNPDGTLKSAYEMQAAHMSDPASRLGELDRRQNAVGQVNFNNVGNTGALANLAALNVKAYNPNLSEAAQAQNALVDNNMRRAIDKNNQTSAGAEANARDNLAAGGGLSSGARGQVAMQAMRNRMLANAGAHADANSGKLSIASQDWQQKNALQNQLPSMYQSLGSAQTDVDKYNANMGMDKVNNWAKQAGAEDTRAADSSKFNATADNSARAMNINNAMNDANLTDQFAMDKWKTGNAAQGNYYTANAQNYYANQQANRGLLGNSGGILGTGFAPFG